MSPSGTTNDQVDRLTRCSACKRPFEPVASRFASENAMICPACGHENRAMRLPQDQSSGNDLSLDATVNNESFMPERQHQVSTPADGEDEFALAPIQAERPTAESLPGPELRLDHLDASEVHSADPRGYKVPLATQRDDATRRRLPVSEGPVPHRSYPTLESIGRLYRLFGYVGVLSIFGYLIVQFFFMVWGSPEGEFLTRLVAFSEFALPFVFGTVIGAGALFAASEAIQLAMDIQENTLRAAYQNRERSEATQTETTNKSLR